MKNLISRFFSACCVEEDEQARISGFLSIYSLNKMPSSQFPIEKYLKGDFDGMLQQALSKNQSLFFSGPYQISTTIEKALSRLEGVTNYPKQAYLIRLNCSLEETVRLTSTGKFHEALLDAYDYQTIKYLLQTEPSFSLEKLSTLHFTLDKLSLNSITIRDIEEESVGDLQAVHLAYR